MRWALPSWCSSIHGPVATRTPWRSAPVSRHYQWPVQAGTSLGWIRSHGFPWPAGFSGSGTSTCRRSPSRNARLARCALCLVLKTNWFGPVTILKPIIRKQLYWIIVIYRYHYSISINSDIDKLSLMYIHYYTNINWYISNHCWYCYCIIITICFINNYHYWYCC